MLTVMIVAVAVFVSVHWRCYVDHVLVIRLMPRCARCQQVRVCVARWASRHHLTTDWLTDVLYFIRKTEMSQNKRVLSFFLNLKTRQLYACVRENRVVAQPWTLSWPAHYFKELIDCCQRKARNVQTFWTKTLSLLDARWRREACCSPSRRVCHSAAVPAATRAWCQEETVVQPAAS